LHLSYSASIFLISDSKVEMHLARAVIPNMRPWVRMDSWIWNADVYLCLCRHSSANDILICLTILNQIVIWWRLQTIYRLKHPRSFLHFLSPAYLRTSITRSKKPFCGHGTNTAGLQSKKRLGRIISVIFRKIPGQWSKFARLRHDWIQDFLQGFSGLRGRKLREAKNINVKSIEMSYQEINILMFNSWFLMYTLVYFRLIGILDKEINHLNSVPRFNKYRKHIFCDTLSWAYLSCFGSSKRTCFSLASRVSKSPKRANLFSNWHVGSESAWHCQDMGWAACFEKDEEHWMSWFGALDLLVWVSSKLVSSVRSAVSFVTIQNSCCPS
jgi:hypothetical protein